MVSMSTKQKPVSFMDRVVAAFIAILLVCILIGTSRMAFAATILQKPKISTDTTTYEASSYEEIDCYFSMSFYLAGQLSEG